MYGIEFKDSEIQGGITYAVLTPEFERLVNTMKQEGTLKAAMDDLKAKLDFHRKKAAEIEAALRALESVYSENGSTYQTAVIHSQEFANTGIADAAVILIKRTHRPLHVREIAGALEAGGYVFKTENPIGSIAPVLYMAAKNKKHGLINKGKNTYSLSEIEN